MNTRDCWAAAVVCSFLLLPFGGSVQAAKKVRVGVFAFAPARLVSEEVSARGLWKKYGAKYGVDLQVSYPGDNQAAFIGRRLDIIGSSSLEVAQLRGDEGWEFIMWGRDTNAYVDMYVRGDASYRSLRDLKGKKVVIPGWDTGAAQIGSVILKQWWGLDLRRDFKVVTAPWPVGPQILARGDVEMALNLMPLTLNLRQSGKIRPILGTYAVEWGKRRGTGHLLSIALWISWGDWLRKNLPAARAVLGAWKEGMEIAHNDTLGWVSRQRDFMKKGASDAEVKFYADWFKKYTPTYKDPYLTQAFIDEEWAFLKMASRAGFIKESVLSEQLFMIVR